MIAPTSCPALKLLVVAFIWHEDDMASGGEELLIDTTFSHKEVTSALSQRCAPRGLGTDGETKSGSEGHEYPQLGRKLLFPPNCIYSRPESEGVLLN